jgi:hypothetical protein
VPGHGQVPSVCESECFSLDWEGWERGAWLAAALSVAAALAGAGSAEACSCAQIAPRNALRQADAAIVGELVDVLPRGGGQADYRYEVQRVYKGAGRIGSALSVRGSAQSAACGLPRGVGKRYGLFLGWGEGRWRGGLCGVIAPRQLRLAARQSSRKGAGSASCAS